MNDSIPKSISNLFDIEELASYLKVPVKTVYYWVSRNEIPYMKVGRHLRFDASHIIDSFKKKTQERSPACLNLSTTVEKNELLRSLTTKKCKPAG